MIILPVEDTVEKDVDIRKHDKLGILALEMAIIKNNIEDYPDIQNPAFAGLDLNSRFELSPGMKDIRLLSNYLNKVRNDK